MKLVAISLLFLLLLSCDKESDPDCSLVLPPPNSVEINIIDTNGNALIGSIYVQDSARLYNSTSETFIRPTPFGLSNQWQIFYADIQSNVDYYLELDSTDTDTLRFDYSVTAGECFDSYTINSVLYNGQSALMVGGEDKITLVKE